MELGQSLSAIDPYADSFHVDIMDGTVTPMISFGTWVIPLLKRTLQTPLDIHLYVRNPYELLLEVVKEDVSKVLLDMNTLSKVRANSLSIDKNCLGIYLLSTDDIGNIDTTLLEHASLINIVSVNSLQGGQEIDWDLVERTSQLADIRKDYSLDFKISIDGGIKEENLKEVIRFPVDQVIIGSAIFMSDDPPKQAQIFKTLLSSQ